jgi:NAD(P)-dependent dehydrogenase (short-subunit alcohol dehydrogenase family)
MSESPFDKNSTAEEVSEGIDLTGTTWLITGCNSGLGYETARVMALRGARIIGAARTRQKAADALEMLGIDGVPVACELSDLDSVRGAVEVIRAEGPLKGIIANAGIMALPELQQVHGFERQFFTNHMGHFVLVTGLMDQLTDDGRVVMLSSGAHFYAERGLELDNLSGEAKYEPWRMYGRSKLANILFARSLAVRFEGSARTANAVHPGVIQTNLARHIPDPESMFANLRPRMKTVPQGAATQVYVAVRPELADVSGEYFADCAVAETIPQAKDDVLAEALWIRSEAIAAAC